MTKHSGLAYATDDDGYVVNAVTGELVKLYIDDLDGLDDETRTAQDDRACEWANEIAEDLSTHETVFCGVPDGRAYFLARVGEAVEI